MIAGRDLAELDCDSEPPERGRRIFPAQAWKDLVCAQTVFEAAQDSRVMVIAGCGHTDYSLGIPQRVGALAFEDAWSGLHRQLSYALPIPQLLITSREQGESVLQAFRGRAVANLVLRYEPTDMY
eukprot:gnl/TRDRNA2_/TRDRNA2_87056_c0_seq1.p1 gnl/TRDRNA2_/TRDRNA2_87056_c0~~gnl/TRDRNA2_/TRDRNA2_87056_c0_seq1.p1  ORF type:complete len:125 (+),score=10.14 gnl/TRDRNA2_/TRDRNA2_87056_c0_seq1:99-473(+)